MASSVTIPDGFLSIQAGIDSGADTVLVRNGDYDETPEAYRSLTLKGIGEGRPRVRGLLITNPISLSLHRGFSDIEFTAPVTMNTWNFHARILDIAFDHCTLDSGLVHSYYEDPEDIEYLTLANCEIRGGCQAVSYVVTMQSDTLDDGGDLFLSELRKPVATRTLDDAEVKVEVAEDVFREITQEAWSEDILEADHHMRNLRDSIQSEIKGMIGLNMKVTLMVPATIPRSEGGKLRRVVDLRKL